MKRAWVRSVVVGLVCWMGAEVSIGAQGAGAADDRRVEGTVVDAQGLAVPGARITLTAQEGGLRKSTLSAADRFTFDGLAAGVYELRVDAGGFESASLIVDLRDQPSVAVEVRLETGRIEQQVIVTATRSEQRLGDVPASVNVLHREQIEQSPAVVADDVLRQIPTFSLFRRTSSLSSHPTSQGVSLRGIGPSGVSRTLVLLDNIPFNDPFGGWVYWTRVPLDSTDRIEVVDGATSSLYGNYAMGGVINIVTGRPARRTIEINPQYGNRNSPKLDFFASDAWNKLGAAVDGAFFDTEGFPIVARSERGAVDTKATVDFVNIGLKLDYNPNSRSSGFFRLGYFRENRDNAKVSTFDGTKEANDARWTVVSGGVRLLLPDQSDIQARVFADFETFHSNFLAVPPATPLRSVGRVTTDQTVPVDAVGGMVQWARAFRAHHFVTAGTDWRWVDGESQEDGFDTATGLQVVVKRAAGGTQKSVGAFVQDVITPMPKLVVTLGARLDHWRNYNGHNLETSSPSGAPTANHNPTLPERSDTVVSPRAAALYRVTDWLSVWGDVTSGFRAPTLNELYRSFSVGAVRTLANAELGPERLVGGEAGVNIAPVRDATIRVTWYENGLEDPVANVTIGTNLQQRQNLGRTRIHGLQTDVEYRLGAEWRASAGYLYNQAKVTENPANVALVGNFLPQVPVHRGSFRVTYSNPRYAIVTFGVQFIGRQYDDDQNSRTVPAAALRDAGYDTSLIEPGLPGFAVADLMISRAITPNVDAYFGVQNLFGQEYFVGTLPTTIGSPRLAKGGVRIRFSGR